MPAAPAIPFTCCELHCFAELMAPASPSDAAQPREGRFVIGDESHPLLLRRLPCVVESFKTYDDINLVKTADVGEVAPAQCLVALCTPTSLPTHQPPGHLPRAPVCWYVLSGTTKLCSVTPCTCCACGVVAPCTPCELVG